MKPQSGDVLRDRYQLERPIGEGGMGMVYAARDLQQEQRVAVKVLLAVDEDEHLERFQREARLASRLRSEHVVRILDVQGGDDRVYPFLVMEYLEGKDLGAIVDARGPLPVGEAVGYLVQACSALAEAHALGIVHRDLKPSNLFVTQRPDGSPLVKVLDFGISKAHDEMDAKLTTTRSVFGSPAYMSPEQIRSSKHVDARSDVWSLAVVLFELLTGELPFVGENASAILAAVAADAPASVRARSPHGVPPELEAIIEACLVKDREKRLGSVVELKAALEAVVAGRPSSIGMTVRLAPSIVPASSSGAQDGFATTTMDPQGLAPAPKATRKSGLAIGGLVAAGLVATAAVAAFAVRDRRVQPDPAAKVQAVSAQASEPPPATAVPAPPTPAPALTAAASEAPKPAAVVSVAPRPAVRVPPKQVASAAPSASAPRPRTLNLDQRE